MEKKSNRCYSLTVAATVLIAVLLTMSHAATAQASGFDPTATLCYVLTGHTLEEELGVVDDGYSPDLVLRVQPGLSLKYQLGYGTSWEPTQSFDGLLATYGLPSADQYRLAQLAPKVYADYVSGINRLYGDLVQAAGYVSDLYLLDSGSSGLAHPQPAFRAILEEYHTFVKYGFQDDLSFLDEVTDFAQKILRTGSGNIGDYRPYGSMHWGNTDEEVFNFLAEVVPGWSIAVIEPVPTEEPLVPEDSFVGPIEEEIFPSDVLGAWDEDDASWDDDEANLFTSGSEEVLDLIVLDLFESTPEAAPVEDLFVAGE